MMIMIVVMMIIMVLHLRRLAGGSVSTTTVVSTETSETLCHACLSFDVRLCSPRSPNLKPSWWPLWLALLAGRIRTFLLIQVLVNWYCNI